MNLIHSAAKNINTQIIILMMSFALKKIVELKTLFETKK